MKKSELTEMIKKTVHASLMEAFSAMGEGHGHDRQALVGQMAMLGKKIASRAAFSSVPDGSLAVMISNLEAIATKLQ